jgi:hypothetical protein
MKAVSKHLELWQLNKWLEEKKYLLAKFRNQMQNREKDLFNDIFQSTLN